MGVNGTILKKVNTPFNKNFKVVPFILLKWNVRDVWKVWLELYDILPQPCQGLMFLFNYKVGKSVEFRSNLILLTSTCLVKIVLRIIKCRRGGGTGVGPSSSFSILKGLIEISSNLNRAKKRGIADSHWYPLNFYLI